MTGKTEIKFFIHRYNYVENPNRAADKLLELITNEKKINI